MTAPPQPDSASPKTDLRGLGQKAISGGVWTTISSWGRQLLSLLQTFVVADLLFPEDLGLMVMASMAIATVHVFTQTGLDAAIIFKKDFGKPVAGTAWGVSVARGIFLCLLIFVVSPWIAAFFGEPRVTSLIRALAFIFILDGCTNSWIVELRKELNFHRQAAFSLLCEFTAVATTIFAVWLLHDVWGMVIGRLAGSLMRVISSFFFVPKLPGLSFDRKIARELFGYGRHIMGANLLVFVLMQADDAFVGRVLGKEALGVYYLAYRLSNLPGTAVSQILTRVTFPLYAKLREDRSLTEDVYRRVVELTALLAYPLSGALIVLAPDIVQVFLGQKWMPAVMSMRILCIFGLVRALNAAIGSLFQGIGIPNRVASVSAYQLAIVGLTIYPMGITWGIEGVSACVTIANVIAMALLLRNLHKHVGISIRNWFKAQRLPIIATLVAVSATILVKIAFHLIESPGSLVLLMAIGLSIYLLILSFDHTVSKQLKFVLRFLRR